MKINKYKNKEQNSEITAIRLVQEIIVENEIIVFQHAGRLAVIASQIAILFNHLRSV